MKLGGWDSEKDNSTYIIADVGSNHCGSLDQAIAHIRLASYAGVDCVKFQLFRADTIYPKEGNAEYLGPQSLHSTLQKYELKPEWLPELKKQCDGYGVDFACTPFDLLAVDILNPYVSFWKIASFELNWHTLIAKCRDMGKPIVLSSGGSISRDITDASLVACSDNIGDPAILLCTSQYPADPANVNLRMLYSWTHLGVDVDSDRMMGEIFGLSDHTEHPSLAPCAAVALGARIIEKHFTIRKDLPSPDAKFALNPKQLAQMVDDIRTTEVMIGSSEKKPQPGELTLYKRTLYATENIPAGATLTEQNTACLRNVGKPNPAPPQALGFRLRLPVASGTMITTGDLE